LDKATSDFSLFLGSSPNGTVDLESQNIHYNMIDCLLLSGASKSQLVLYGTSFANATQKLPPGCSTPVVPKIVNPELDKCKKGNDMIESIVKSVVNNSKEDLFAKSEL
jgi:hypothetical protein